MRGRTVPSPPRSTARSYEHTNAICNILNGVPPPKLSPELEARLKAMFAEIQEPFERNCPPNRKNFLSYSFSLYKMCELLGEDHLLRCASGWGFERVPGLHDSRHDPPGVVQGSHMRFPCPAATFPC